MTYRIIKRTPGEGETTLARGIEDLGEAVEAALRCDRVEEEERGRDQFYVEPD